MNVGGENHEIFKPKVVEIDEVENEDGTKIDGEGPNVEFDLESRKKSAALDSKSIQTSTTFKTPNVLITDYLFTPDQIEDTFVHPILGTPDVRNIHEIDWEALKFNQRQEWSEVCQEHYDAVLKLGNMPSKETITPRNALSKKTDTVRPRVPAIKLPPLKK